LRSHPFVSMLALVTTGERLPPSEASRGHCGKGGGTEGVPVPDFQQMARGLLAVRGSQIGPRTSTAETLKLATDQQEGLPFR